MLFYWNLIIYSLLSQTVILCDNIISQSLINYFGSNDIVLHLSNSTIDKLFQLNMANDFICISKGYDQLNKTFPMKYISTQPISYQNHLNLLSDVFETSITLPSEQVTIPLMKLYYVDNPNKQFIDSIPLAFKFNDEQSSIVHCLYNTNQIKQMSFTIIKDQIYGDLNLFIGGLPLEITTQYKYTSKCKVPFNYDKWGCLLNMVMLNGINNVNEAIYVNKYPFYFQSNMKNIYAPKDFMEFIYENVFKDLIAIHECWVCKSENGSQETLRCNRNSSEIIKNVELVINGKVFTIMGKDLFQIYVGGNEFIIGKNKYNDNEWVIGNVFLNNYISYFDYIDKSITFYTEYPLKTVICYRKDDQIKNIFIICIAIMIVNILSILIIKRTKNINSY